MTATGYIRQSSSQIVTGNTIQASDFNNEYNAIQTAFDGTIGHDHSGGTGLGQKLNAATALTGTALPSSIVTSSLTSVGTIATGVWHGTAIADTYISSAAKWNAITSAYSGGATGGTADVLTLTIAGFNLAVGTSILCFLSNTNTGAATLNINGGGAQSIKKIGAASLVDVEGGDLVAGLPMIFAWDGTEWLALLILYAGTVNTISGPYSLGNVDLFNSLVATTGLTITLPATTSVFPYFYVNINAKGGAVILAPNGTDNIQGANVSFTIPQGTSGLLTTDGSGNWYVNGTGGGVIPASVGGTGVNNSTKTITLGGNLVTSGSNSITFTSTGATNVTLPTTGTLATLAGSETLTNKTLTNPVLTTPTLGVATVTSINKVAITAPASSATLTIADGKTLTASNTLTFTGTDSSSVAFGSGGTVAYTNVATLSSLASIGTITTGVWNGTTIAVANGGTGLTTLTANNVILGNGSSAPTFVAPGTSGNVLTSNGTTWTSAAISNLAAASQAQMEAASSNLVAVTPGVAVYHPGMAKAWVIYNGVTNSILASYNVTSVTDNGSGDFTINFTTAFSSANYGISGMCNGPTATVYGVQIDTSNVPTASACRINVVNAGSGALTDVARISVAFFGDQ